MTYYSFFSGVVIYDWQTRKWKWRRFLKSIKRLDRSVEMPIKLVRRVFRTNKPLTIKVGKFSGKREG